MSVNRIQSFWHRQQFTIWNYEWSGNGTGKWFKWIQECHRNNIIITRITVRNSQWFLCFKKCAQKWITGIQNIRFPMITLAKITKTIYNLACVVVVCYLICFGIVCFVVIEDVIDLSDIALFHRSHESWCRQVLWDIDHSLSIWEKFITVMMHSAIILKNHINEILVVFFTASVLPIQSKCMPQ